MKSYFLYLFVVAAIAARPYRYGREEYRPARRFSERYLRGAAPVYLRSSSRALRNLEEEPYHIPEPRRPLVQEQPEEVLERSFSPAQISRSLSKEEEVRPYAEVEETPNKEIYEDRVEENGPPVEKESQDYQSKSQFDEFEGDTYEEELESHDEDRAGGEEAFDDDYQFERVYADSDDYNLGYDEYEEHEGKHEDVSGEESAVVEKYEEQEQHTMPLELADIVFSFANCNSITCSKAGFEGYGCSDSKCKFICSKSECYEYPDGPTDLEELEALEEVHQIEPTTTTEEITTTTEEITTATTTVEPETTIQVMRRRRPNSDKRGKGRRVRSRP